MERITSYPDRPTYGGQLDFIKRISWSAVFAGVLVAIVTQMLLTLLGLGIGLGTIDPLQEANPTAGLGIGSAIWYIISSLLSLFVGGWVAGRLASAPPAVRRNHSRGTDLVSGDFTDYLLFDHYDR